MLLMHVHNVKAKTRIKKKFLSFFLDPCACAYFFKVNLLAKLQ